MNIKDLFKSVSQKQKMCKLRDLIVLAYADGYFTDDERAPIMLRDSLNEDVINRVMDY